MQSDPSFGDVTSRLLDPRSVRTDWPPSGIEGPGPEPGSRQPSFRPLRGACPVEAVARGDARDSSPIVGKAIGLIHGIVPATL
jgi:hypothetical protein